MGRAKSLMNSVVREKPSITIDQKTLPAIKDWKIGKKYKITLDAELLGLNKDEWDEKTPLRARFRIHDAEECDDDE